MRVSLLTLVYLAVGVVVALGNGYNSVATVSDVISLALAVIFWPAVLLGIDPHVPAIAT